MWRVFLALAVTRTAAFAGACPNPHYVRVDVEDGAPTNAELRVYFGGETDAVYDLGPNREVLAQGEVSARTDALVLRTAAGVEMPVTLRRALNMEHPEWLARPVKPLAPHTSYIVSVGKWKVGQFTTGDGPLGDATAVTVKKVAAKRWPDSNDWKSPHGKYVELTLDRAAMIEVHELAAGEAPSETTLRFVSRGADKQVRLGASGPCLGSNFDLSLHHVWVRAFDTAGNVSALQEVSI